MYVKNKINAFQIFFPLTSRVVARSEETVDVRQFYSNLFTKRLAPRDMSGRDSLHNREFDTVHRIRFLLLPLFALKQSVYDLTNGCAC